MTLPSASPPGFDSNAPRRNLADHGAASSESSDAARRAEGPPSNAVSLADLISDSGPLPPDAALECIQRIAERLAGENVAGRAIDATNVLIDDDGGIWLEESPTFVATRPEPTESSGAVPSLDTVDGMHKIGRLLMYLVSGDRSRLDDAASHDVSHLPTPLESVARRLFSRNGSCYPSCAELAREVASLRGETPQQPRAAVVHETAAVAQTDEPPSEPASEPEPAETASSEHEVTQDSSPAGFGILVLLFLAAVIGLAIWLSL